MQRQIIYNMVEGDTEDTPVRFTGLSTADYTTIKLKFKKENGLFFARTLVYDATDLELATIPWETGDIVAGEHTAEFELDDFRLPRQFPVIFRVRAKNG
ncbi:MAG: hypothetical protein GY765_34385 [bacterium]|nr:hypothetical protein [bacterium]